MYTKSFKQLTKLDTNIAGGKGASLGEMINSKIPVPDGFVVLSDTFEQFLKDTDLNVEIDAVLDTVDINKIHTIDGASAKINSMILSQEISKEISKEILSSFKKMGSKFVAVRSSATAEDSSSAAWAGQLETYLNTTEKKLLENVKKCWASLFTPRAIFYRFEQKLNNQKISVAVVVQKMINSEESGIAFSVHPVTQDYNQLIIEAGLGLGEAIVSGQITPDSYVIDKQDWNIIDINVNEQEKGLFRDKTGGNIWRDLGARGKEQVLNKKEIIELSKLIVKIENHYGFPVDVEWAKESGKFYITQSRPITTLFLKEDKIKEEVYITPKVSTYPFFFSANILSPTIEYKGKKIIGEFYSKFIYDGISSSKIPSSSLEVSGKYFLNLLLNRDKDFSKYLFNLSKKVISLADELEQLNYESLKNNKIIGLKDFYPKYKDVFSEAFGIGGSLDFVLDEYVKENNIDLNSLNKIGQSFISKEKNELKKIFEEKNKKKFKEKLIDHSFKYSWIENNYTGEHRKDITYYIEQKKDIEKYKFKKVAPKICTPTNIKKWISFLIFIRDERKRANLIALGLLDRYLKNECKKLDLDYNKAVMLQVEEFEKQKKTKLKDYGGVRYMYLTNGGPKNLTKKVGEELFGEERDLNNNPLYPNIWSSSIRWQFEAYPFFTSVYLLASQEQSKNYYYEFSYFINHFFGGQLEAYITKDILDFGKIEINELINGVDSYKKVAFKILKEINEAIKICENAKNNSLIIDLDFWWPKVQSALSNIASILFSFDFALNDWMNELQMSDKKLFDILSKSIKEKRVSFLEEATLYLKKLADKYGSNFDKIYPEFIRKYSWIQNSYKGQFLITKEWLKNYYLEIKFSKKNKLEKETKNNVPNKYLLLVDFASDVVSLRDDKKKLLLVATELMEIWLRQICNENCWEYDEMKWLTMDEIQELINGNNDYLDLAKRCGKNNERYGLMNPKGYVDISKKLFDEVRYKYSQTENPSEIKGVGVSKGKVSGTVKIVLDPKNNIVDFKDGDILVTSMTRPEFLPLMNKAVAFITDEGGITCHASIISRELKKPCIIGTKIATQVLKDGDYVEVDADNGIVKIIERKKR